MQLPLISKTRAVVIALHGFLFALCAVPVAAQNNVPVELIETDPFGMGARAMGMGKAYQAVSEDVSALHFNPAGLAQIRRPELSVGVAHDDVDRTVDHVEQITLGATNTRLEHVAFAYPVPTYRGSFVVGFGFHRFADLDQRFLKEGSLDSSGLYERERYVRDGAINAYTGALGYDLSLNVSVGASLTYLDGTSYEEILTANGILGSGGLSYGDPSNPDNRLFREEVLRDADVTGYTGSLAILAYVNPQLRTALILDLPTRLDYEGFDEFSLEDWEKIDSGTVYFEDQITLPPSVAGGISWGKDGFLLAAGARWTDYTQIDYEGEILAPDGRESAYRSVVAFHLGGEFQFPSAPVRVRGGFFTEPLPYRLLSADSDFNFVADDNNQNTTDDVSVVYRDYPDADIVSDRKYFTAGAGVVIQESLTLDVAYLHGRWERQTPAGYENTTDFYPTTMTREEVTQNRVFVSATMHFQ